jgi:hypothetical protein
LDHPYFWAVMVYGFFLGIPAYRILVAILKEMKVLGPAHERAFWSAWYSARNKYRRVKQGHPPTYQRDGKPTCIDYTEEFVEFMRKKQMGV